MEFLTQHVPGLKNIRLLQSANSLGIRESRRAVGGYMLTPDAMAAGRSFEDIDIKRLWQDALFMYERIK